MAAEYENAAAEPNGTRFVTPDHLGSPRVVTDAAGVVSRHDYAAFGDEVFDGAGPRTTADKYGSDDGLRQQFTGYERDGESELDFAQARYYNSRHGRFTSPDPLTASATLRDPQSFNRYSYVQNDPVSFIDPSGLNLASNQRCYEVVTGYWDGDGKAHITDTRPWGCVGGMEAGGADLGSGGGAATPQKPAKVCPPTGKQLANDPTVQSAALQACAIQDRG